MDFVSGARLPYQTSDLMNKVLEDFQQPTIFEKEEISYSRILVGYLSLRNPLILTQQTNNHDKPASRSTAGSPSG